MSDPSGLEAVIDELYGLPPTDFVARRDELAKQARGDGDRELATAIKALRRPTVGANYLNLASRSGLTSLRELLDLGKELREKQAAGDFAALRELAARRGPLVTRVLRDLTVHLADVGVTTTGPGLDEVRTTLGAALADPAVDDQVRAGRLDRAHSYGGFGEVEMATLPAADKEEHEAEREHRASQKDTGPTKQELAAAKKELAAAERERTATEARRKEAGVRVRAARKRVESLESELERARDALSAAEQETAGLAATLEALTEGIESARRLLA